MISGALAAVEKAAALCKAKGARRAVMLPVSAPFHCALMQPAQEEVARVLAGLQLTDPRIPVAANVSGTMVTTADGARDALIEQVTGAVRWVDCMRALIGAEAEVFVEVGPGKVLCGLAEADRSRAEVAECGRRSKPGEDAGGAGRRPELHPAGCELASTIATARGRVPRRRREVQRVVLGIVGEEQRLALAPVDQHPHQQHVLEYARRHNLVALDHAVFVLRCCSGPSPPESDRRGRRRTCPGAAASWDRASRCRRPASDRSSPPSPRKCVDRVSGRAGACTSSRANPQGGRTEARRPQSTTNTSPPPLIEHRRGCAVRGLRQTSVHRAGSSQTFLAVKDKAQTGSREQGLESNQRWMPSTRLTFESVAHDSSSS